MDRRRIVLIALAAGLVAGGLWLKYHFSATNVIRRTLYSSIEAFEGERILGAVKVVSRGYQDEWGMSYESLAGHMKAAMDTYDDLEVDLRMPSISVDGERATMTFTFILWGTYDGTRGYIFGSRSDPAKATLAFRKETPGWRIIATEELDIPELEEELEEMSSEKRR